MSGSAAQFVLIAAALAGCAPHGSCDTVNPPAEQVQLTSSEWDAITKASGELKSARALEMCEEKLGLEDSCGRWGWAEECGELCLSCSWERCCKY